MLDPRLYRVAFVPVLLAVLVAAFSLADRPRPIGTTLAPDAFDGARALQTLDQLAASYPDRRPGSRGDDALAQSIAGTLKGLVPGTVNERRFDARTIDGTRTLAEVVATRPGAPGPGIVVVAHRDAAGHGAKAELSGTAALLELARVAGDGRLRRTITFISTSGGSGGFAGAIHAADSLGGPQDAVLVLGDLSAPRLRRPLVVGWSNGRGQASLRLRRTVESAIRSELGTDPGGARALMQWARLAVPVTISEQGPFVRDGQPAVLLSANGERPPRADQPVREARLQALGRAALRTLYALDNGPDIAGRPRSDLIVRGKVLPGWAVRMLVGALLLPPLLMAVDGFARLRRRREPIGRWMRWTLSSALPFVLVAMFALLLGAVGLIDEASGAPVPGAALVIDAGAIAAMVALALVFVLGWLVVRPRALGAGDLHGRPDTPGAAMGTILVVCGGVFVLWLINPYAAALLVPAAHLWTWSAAPGSRLPRAVALLFVLAGLVLPAALVLADAHAFSLGTLQTAWFWTILLAGGHFPAVIWLLWSVIGGAGVATVLVVLRRRREKDAAEREVTVRGPVSYAGPGSLGGTKSALRP